MSQYVQITFDCLPLRSVGRFDIPMDASPRFRALGERIKHAAEKHGLHNTYYLHNAHCVYHLTNDEQTGVLRFRFEGTLLTDSDDRNTVTADLDVELKEETCDWLTEPVVAWFRETVAQAVRVEFDRYIAAGDLAQTVARIERVQAESDEHGGFLGMGL
jgi:hypothetical protein